MTECQLYEATVITSLKALAEVVPDWKELQETALGEFQHDLSFIELYLRLQRPDASPVVVLLWDSGRLVGAAPFMLEVSTLRLRLSVLTLLRVPVRQLRFFGRDLLLAQDTEPVRAMRSVLAALERQKIRFGAIYLELVPTNSALYRSFRGGRIGSMRMIAPRPRFDVLRQIQIEGSFAEYLATRRRKTRRSVRVLRETLQAAVDGQIEFVRVTDREQVPTFLEELDQLFPSTWQARTFGVRKRNDERSLAFMSEIAASGWLRSYLLRCRGAAIAYVVGYQYQGVFRYDETGYDQAWANLAPGTVLLHYNVQDLFESQRPKLLDFGFGENIYKRVLGNQEVEICSAYIVRSGSVYALLLGLQRNMNRAYSAVRDALVRTGWDVRVRRVLKRKGSSGGKQESPTRTEVEENNE